MRKVLICAREEVVAALLGLMVELHGLQPKFIDRLETVDDAIRQQRPVAVLIDCDHPDCTDALIETIKRLAATPILFSPFRVQHESTGGGCPSRRSVVHAPHGSRCFRKDARRLSFDLTSDPWSSHPYPV